MTIDWKLLINRGEDGFRNELVTGFVQVNAVACQDAFFFVVGVALRQVIDERFPQVAELHLSILCDLPANLGILVELCVRAIALAFFSPITVGVQSTTRAPPLSLIFSDDVFQTFFVLVLAGALRWVFLAVPHVVDADVNDHQRRLLCENVLIDPLLQVGYFVAADAGPDHFNVQVFVLFVQRVLDERDVAIFPGTLLRDGVAEEDDFLALSSTAGRRRNSPH